MVSVADVKNKIKKKIVEIFAAMTISAPIDPKNIERANKLTTIRELIDDIKSDIANENFQLARSQLVTLKRFVENVNNRKVLGEDTFGKLEQNISELSEQINNAITLK